MPATTALLTFFHLSVVPITQDGQAPAPRPGAPPAEARGLKLRTDAATPGLTLLAPLRSTSTYLVDLDGKVVHEWKSDATPGHTVVLRENGHLVRAERVDNDTFWSGGQGGRVRELDRDGKSFGSTCARTRRACSTSHRLRRRRPRAGGARRRGPRGFGGPGGEGKSLPRPTLRVRPPGRGRAGPPSRGRAVGTSLNPSSLGPGRSSTTGRARAHVLLVRACGRGPSWEGDGKVSRAAPVARPVFLQSSLDREPRAHVDHPTNRPAIHGLRGIRRRNLMFRVVPVLCLALASCASIVSKSDWPVTIDSNPPGASLKIWDENGKVVYSGSSPTTLTLAADDGYFKKADYDIEATLPGYSTTRSRMSARLNGWYWGNILFGGLIGMLIVDPATGAMWKLKSSHTLNLSATTP